MRPQVSQAADIGAHSRWFGAGCATRFNNRAATDGVAGGGKVPRQRDARRRAPASLGEDATGSAGEATSELLGAAPDEPGASPSPAEELVGGSARRDRVAGNGRTSPILRS